MDRNIVKKIFLNLFLVASIFITYKESEFQGQVKAIVIENGSENEKVVEVEKLNVSSSRMTYGRFLEYLDMGWVKQVDLYDNSRNAIVQASSPELGNRPQSIRVEIPVGASQLIQKLKASNFHW